MLGKFSTLSRAAAFGFILLLGGCGGGGGSDGSSGSNGNQPNTGGQSGPGGDGDSFISRVLSVIGSSSDTAEPIDIKSIEATTPDNADPISVN